MTSIQLSCPHCGGMLDVNLYKENSEENCVEITLKQTLNLSDMYTFYGYTVCPCGKHVLATLVVTADNIEVGNE